ncbi:transglycosylase domain-containing protein [Crenobacter sp. SG2303]|uniref:peptidoglycan glycosyltransferase n=1 Tax=Crenobacter oryzisoli TaxID=3056844 RepID=A0ABT7XUD1_9NEIS|nr:transglycosylase domain-containing protein [Crenobacter sp. SG2303]MDN0077368.1 transglycosylase domain-containing protein [Crenobacter sp. SG2303]
MSAPVEEELQPKKRISTKLRIVLVLVVLFLAMGGLLVYFALDEFRTSRLQAQFFAGLGRELTFQVESGPSQAIRFPQEGGPYDLRFGYADMPTYLGRLEARDFDIESQARQSQRMTMLFDEGLFMPYHEKDQAGLTVLDRANRTIYQTRYPQRLYPNLEAVPRLLTDSLLYIENHTLLDPSEPRRNPAVEWSRFGKALSDEAIHLVKPGYRPPGGSTLATQIEKYRHSPEGRTGSPLEKLRQMLSASVRAYLNGEDTTAARQQLVVDYLNTVPLAARAGFGEIAGVGDGLWAWYGRDFDEANRLLSDDPTAPLAERALVYKEALSLLISQRSPSYFLGGDIETLEALTDSYLRLMSKAGVITPELRDAALDQSLKQQKERVRLPSPPPIERKGANAVRTQLASLLGVRRMYDLDRLDLTVKSTLDLPLQQAVTAELIKLRDPDYAQSVGLVGKDLLAEGNPTGVTYSFTLLERTPNGNRVRVQADNFDQPFDINEGVKLDLGSTAKLRTLINYLQIIAQLHDQYMDLDRQALNKVEVVPQDPIRRWAVDYLAKTPDHSLSAMLAASLERKYSANPGESFFTGGGLHSFVNFDRNDNSRILTVREATRRSVNLVYIRLMRDIVHYYLYQDPGTRAALLGDTSDPRRQQYLETFADREGRVFLAGFYRKYHGKSFPEAEAALVDSIHATPKRLAVIFRSIEPDADQVQMAKFIATYLPRAGLDEEELGKMYDEYSVDRFNLADRGYLAGVHPLELWLLNYLRVHPAATYSEVMEASTAQRQEVYHWLFKTRNKYKQDKRIKQLLEIEAFKKVHQTWKALGYPFESLVPSYATALGASADRPSALADLMGVIVNDGVRLPTLRIDSLHFAAGTPYDTRLGRGDAKPVRVLPPEIPQLVRQVLSEVVEQGTARRVAGAFTAPSGKHLMVGGKTGTGDNRFKTFARGGAVTSERVVSRSGAFVFYIGDRYFGTLLAYVAGPKAANYKFTSALPVQILKVLAPTLKQQLDLQGLPTVTPPPAAPVQPPQE